MTEPRIKDETQLALSNLSTGLWRIHDLLESLHYKLEVQNVLIETGRSAWLGRSTQEIEFVIESLRETELMRVVDVSPVCDLLGLPQDTPLSQIAQAAPSPWDHVLEEHRLALAHATQELSLLSRSNSDMLEISYRAVQDTLERFNHSPEGATYTARGSREAGRSHHLIDHVG
ncbi:flagellar export chaperone FlgN [Austwickia chelonae]|uniref:flagellar export chaperone FlgN n=1 Tax=Austwickia chelonae TaxID=100225 RepID=UPI000E264E9C|nr:flagellar export chaperone FlgN [Austwickia chelonae]